MKVLIVNFSDSRGGAAIASRKQALAMKSFGYDVDFVVAEKNLDDDVSIGPTMIEFFIHYILRVFAYCITYAKSRREKVKNSLNIFSSYHICKYLKKDYDLVHLHWINNECLSLNKLEYFINRSSAKYVITLHDEWLFSGCEHYSIDSEKYSKGLNENISFLDRYTIKKKVDLKYTFISKRVQFTVPSNDMLTKARNSPILKGLNVNLIPNIIDVDSFKPFDKLEARKQLGLSKDNFLIAFGASGGHSYLKGSDLLLGAIRKISTLSSIRHQLVTFGKKAENQDNLQLSDSDIVNFGHIDSKEFLSKIYSAADVLVVPSRLEAFGQVAAECLACGTPVIAFCKTGLSDIIQHDVTGYLVERQTPEGLADAIITLANLSDIQRQDMGMKGRKYIIDSFSGDEVRNKWLDLYSCLGNR